MSKIQHLLGGAVGIAALFTLSAIAQPKTTAPGRATTAVLPDLPITLAKACPPLMSKAAGPAIRACAADESACPRYDASKPLSLRSNLCVAKSHNMYVKDAAGGPVDYSLFGHNDCRTGAVRDLKSITKVVIHNGGYTAKMNAQTWECRAAASHYTIDRQGRIFQHAGEERVTWHAGPVNNEAIGIELNIGKLNGKSCNSLSSSSTKEQIKSACAPSPEQYISLKNLLNAIAQRTSVQLKSSHIVGHCEVVEANGHGDPRAFDWSRIGLSNAEKLKFVRDRAAAKKPTACGFYDVFL